MINKKICFFVGNISNSGGTERVLSLIANSLYESGFDIKILSLFSENNIPFFDLHESIKCKSLFNKPIRGSLYLPLIIIKLFSFLKKEKIDSLINVESMLCLFSIPALFFNKKIKNICWEHFNYNVSLGKTSRRLARKLACHYCNDIVTLTEKDKQFWIKNNKIHGNIIAINNPVSEIYSDVPFENKKEKVFLALGRYTFQKGFDLLLESWALSSKKDGWKLKIVGDGEDKEKLLNLSDKLNISDSIEFLETTKDVRSLYLSSAYYIMSSRFEGLPMVLLEAITYGLPIISFDCDTGPSEIVKNGINGYLCPPLDIKCLSNLIDKGISDFENEGIYNTLCNNSLLMSKSFSITNIINKWVDILK